MDIKIDPSAFMNWSDEKVENFLIQVAKLMGYNGSITNAERGIDDAFVEYIRHTKYSQIFDFAIRYDYELRAGYLSWSTFLLIGIKERLVYPIYHDMKTAVKFGDLLNDVCGEMVVVFNDITGPLMEAHAEIEKHATNVAFFAMQDTVNSFMQKYANLDGNFITRAGLVGEGVRLLRGHFERLCDDNMIMPTTIPAGDYRFYFTVAEYFQTLNMTGESFLNNPHYFVLRRLRQAEALVYRITGYAAVDIHYFDFDPEFTKYPPPVPVGRKRGPKINNPNEVDFEGMILELIEFNASIGKDIVGDDIPNGMIKLNVQLAQVVKQHGPHTINYFWPEFKDYLWTMVYDREKDGPFGFPSFDRFIDRRKNYNEKPLTNID